MAYSVGKAPLDLSKWHALIDGPLMYNKLDYTGYKCLKLSLNLMAQKFPWAMRSLIGIKAQLVYASTFVTFMRFKCRNRHCKS